MTTSRALSIVLAATLALPVTQPVAPASAQDYKPNTVWGEVPETVRPSAAHVELQGLGGAVSGITQIGNDGRFSFLNVLPGTYYVVVNDPSRNGLAQSRVVLSERDAVHATVFDGMCGTGTPFVEGRASEAMPPLAREYGPNTIWGRVPGSSRSSGFRTSTTDKAPADRQHAVLSSFDGRQVESVLVQEDGSFAFRNVAAGHYVVTILDGPQGQQNERARSWEISFAAGTSRMAVFASGCVALIPRVLGNPVAVASVAAAGGHTGLIIAGAVATGLGAVIIYKHTQHEPASGSR